MLKSLRALASCTRRRGHQLTAILDEPSLRTPRACRWPPIFLIGPPRSGTTLLYQVITHYFKLAFVTNIANRFYMCPVTATRLGRLILPEHDTQFESTYGEERGFMAPSEAGNIWNRWFPHEKTEGYNYTPAGYLSEASRSRIQRIVANLEDLYSAPFANKNVKWSVRIAALSEIFPDALFIEVQREPLDSALSLLLLLKRNNAMWWSVMPKEIDDLRDLPEPERITGQIYYVRQNIAEDVARNAPDRHLVVAYDALCDDLKGTVDIIDSFLGSRGCCADRREGREYLKFHKSRPRWEENLSPDEVNEVERATKNLFG